MKGYRLFRRMRERAYKDGYLDATADHTITETARQGHRPPPDRALLPPLEDPFLASDWQEIKPTPVGERPSDYGR